MQGRPCSCLYEVSKNQRTVPREDRSDQVLVTARAHDSTRSLLKYSVDLASDAAVRAKKTTSGDVRLGQVFLRETRTPEYINPARGQESTREVKSFCGALVRRGASSAIGSSGSAPGIPSDKKIKRLLFAKPSLPAFSRCRKNTRNRGDLQTGDVHISKLIGCGSTYLYHF